MISSPSIPPLRSVFVWLAVFAVGCGVGDGGDEPGAELVEEEPNYCAVQQWSCDSFVDGPEMNTPRVEFESALADGELLVFGGKEYTGDEEEPWELTDSTEILDPETDAFREVAPMNERRSRFGTLELQDGSVLVAAGSGPMDFDHMPDVQRRLSSVERFDPASETWIEKPPIPADVEWVAMTELHDGRVFLAGHMPETDDVMLSFVFDRDAEEWTELSDLEHRLVGFDVAAVGDDAVLVLVAHPEDQLPNAASYQYLNRVSAFLYDLEGDSWDFLETLEPVQGGLSPAIRELSDRDEYLVELSGGPQTHSFGYLFDPDAESWSEIYSKTGELRFSAGILPDGRILYPDQSPAEILDVDTGEWADFGDHPYDKSRPSVVLLDDCRAFLYGSTYTARTKTPDDLYTGFCVPEH